VGWQESLRFHVPHATLTTTNLKHFYIYFPPTREAYSSVVHFARDVNNSHLKFVTDCSSRDPVAGEVSGHIFRMRAVSVAFSELLKLVLNCR